MKVLGPQIRQADSLGRGNLGAVSGVANAISANANAETRLANAVGKVAEEFIVRKENSEHSSAKTNTMLGFNDVDKTIGVKEFFTADEVKDLPAGSVNLTNPDGTKRLSIPAYEVAPQLINQQKTKIIEQQSESISNPYLRDDYVNLANGILSKSDLANVLKASEDQKKYYRDVAKDESLQLAAKGNLPSAIKTIQEGEFDELTEKKLIRNRQEVFEWETDTRLLDSMNLDDVIVRYNELIGDDYGKKETDYLGSGKASGSYNRAADIDRFEKYIKTARGSRSNAEYLRIKELIRSAGKGNLGDKNELYRSNNEKQLIRQNPFLTQNQKNELLMTAPVSRWEGTALNKTRLSSFSEDRAMILSGEKALSDMDATLNDERVGLNEAIAKASKNKEKLVKKDATTYFQLFSPAVAALLKNLNDPDVQKDPARYKGAMSAFLHTSRVEQEQMGLTPQEVNFLTKDNVNRFKEASNKIGRDALGVPKMIVQMDQLREQYQNEWPAVYGQLIREGALNPEHVMGSIIKDPAVRAQYIQAIESQEDREKTQVYKTNEKQVRQDVNNAMLPLSQTLFTAGAANNVEQGLSVDMQMQHFQNGVVQVLLSQLRTGGKYNPIATNQFVEKILDDNWEFYQGVRVPKNKKFDVDDVVTGLEDMRNMSRLRLPDGMKFAGVEIVGLSPEDNQIEFRKSFIRSAVPSTNSDETGVIFKYSSGDPVMVIKKGRFVPLNISFEDIANFARERKIVSGFKLEIE